MGLAALICSHCPLHLFPFHYQCVHIGITLESSGATDMPSSSSSKMSAAGVEYEYDISTQRVTSTETLPHAIDSDDHSVDDLMAQLAALNNKS
jgi:hypothetical protein